MLIDPRHLEQLSVIVVSGTLLEAARQLGTSQPTLSRMISNLETRAGMLLFERSSRPLRPTALGAELADQGRTIRTARLRAAELVDFGTRGFFGVLKIGAPPFLCQRLVSEAIASFIAARPEIRVDLVPDYLAGLHERIFQNQIDIIIGPAKFVEAGNPEFQLEPLFTDAHVIVGRIKHPLTEKVAVSAADLTDVTWIGHSDRSLLRYDMEEALKFLGIRNLRLAFQSESAGAVMELLRSTDCLTVLPRYAVRANFQDGLAIVQIPMPAREQIVSMITLANREKSKLTADFKVHLREYIKTRYQHE
ncbi:LysR family transcriptional regulator [Yoonia sp. MH D7]